MRPDWSIILPILAVISVMLLALYIKRELRRTPLAPREPEPEVVQMGQETHNGEYLHRPLVSPASPHLALGPPTNGFRRMKVYLITVSDKATINLLDVACGTDDQLFIGDNVSHGPIADIREYVNVSD